MGAVLAAVAVLARSGRRKLPERRRGAPARAPFDRVPALRVRLVRGRRSPGTTTYRSSATWFSVDGAGAAGPRIGLVYPAVELTTAVLLAGCLLAFGVSLHAAAAAVFCAALVVVTATDLSHRIVPNVVVLPAAAVVLALMTVAEPSPQWAIAAAAASGFLFAAALAYPSGMGMGDVKLALLMGAALGRTVSVALLLGDGRRARPLGRVARASRLEGAEDGDSVRAVPGARLGRRPLRRRHARPRLPEPVLRRR